MKSMAYFILLSEFWFWTIHINRLQELTFHPERETLCHSSRRPKPNQHPPALQHLKLLHLFRSISILMLLASGKDFFMLSEHSAHSINTSKIQGHQCQGRLWKPSKIYRSEFIANLPHLQRLWAKWFFFPASPIAIPTLKLLIRLKKIKVIALPSGGHWAVSLNWFSHN